MADIRVERKGGAKAWVWVLLALVVLALALFLLYQAGYIDLPESVGTAALHDAPLAQLLHVAGFHS